MNGVCTPENILNCALPVHILFVFENVDIGVSVGRLVTLQAVLFGLIPQCYLLVPLDYSDVEEYPQDVGEEVECIEQPEECHSECVGVVQAARSSTSTPLGSPLQTRQVNQRSEIYRRGDPTQSSNYQRLHAQSQ